MQYYTIATEIGTAAASNAFLTGTKVNITTFVVGDGGGIEYAPTPDMTELRSEVWRGVVSHAEIDTDSPNVINYTALLPSTVGGFVMREMGIMDDQGRLIGIGNMASTPKIRFDQGISDEIELTFSLTISSPEAMEWKVDPTVILATKADIAAHNLSVESHPDIRDELSDINTQLSNKAEAKFTLLSSRPQTAQEFWALEPGKYTWVQTAPYAWQPEDTPSGNLRVALIMERGKPGAGTVYADMAYTDGGTSLRRYTGEPTPNNEGVRWARLATAAAPQKFELPLAKGWTKYQQPYYQRNTFGEVTIWGSVKKDSAIAQGDVIATMPAGFRIPVSAELPAIKLLEGAAAAAAVFVRSYGDITAATTSTGSAVLSFVITYAGQ